MARLRARRVRLQSNIVEHGISKEPLQLGVLVFQALQALRLRNIHPAELRLPGIKRRRADPVLAAKISCRNPRLLLAQNRHDLFLCKPRSLHRPVLPSVRTLASSGGLCGGHSRSPSLDDLTGGVQVAERVLVEAFVEQPLDRPTSPNTAMQIT